MISEKIEPRSVQRTAKVNYFVFFVDRFFNTEVQSNYGYWR